MTYEDAVRLAERYVGAYTARDLDAMLAVLDENVVSHPAPLYGHRPHVGHAGVREWWSAVVASGVWYGVAVNEVRQIGRDRIAILGEMSTDSGSRIGPWAAILRVRGGLIAESRTYLSERDLLDDLGLPGESSVTS